MAEERSRDQVPFPVQASILYMKTSYYVCVFLAKVKLSECMKTSAVTYIWTVYKQDGSDASDVEYNNQFPRLVIRGGLEGGKKYRATLLVRMQSDSSLEAEASVDIEVEQSNPVALISGSQTFGANDVVILSAGNSYDPDKVKFKVAQYLWTVSFTSGATVIANGRSIVDSLTLNTSVLRIAAGQYLKPGNRYLIELEYRIGVRVGKTRTFIKILPGSPPMITPRLIKGVVNPAKGFAIIVDIKSKSSISSVTWWNQDDVEGTVLGSKRVSVFFIDKDELVGGADYTFTIQVTNTDGTAEANITITTNERPTAGKYDRNKHAALYFKSKNIEKKSSH